MPQFIYSLNQVGKVVGANQHILKNISLSFFPGAKIGILGLNGSGKSTLLRIMAGIDADIIGEAIPAKEIHIGYLEQEPQLDYTKTVRQNIELGLAHIVTAKKDLEQVYQAYSEPDADFEALANKQQQLENIIAVAGAHNLEHKVAEVANALNTPDLDSQTEHLSGGEKRRVALSRLLIASPDMLLLDEPTNHLDAMSVNWLEQFLAKFKGTVVAITHDRYFLDNIAGWILELDRGRGIPYKGNYTQWLETKETRLKQESKTEDARQRKISKELEWARTNPKGRRSKSKVRLKNLTEISSQNFQQRQETNEIYIPPGPRLGSKVIEIKNLHKQFGQRQIIQDLSLNIPSGAIVGIIGPNGAGKSTLLKMIAGSEQPDSGSIELGNTVKISFVEQSRDNLRDEDTVWEAISDKLDIIAIGQFEISSRAYIGRFNFKGQQQQKRVKDLSGGERGRLHLAHTLKQGANVLLLDEPSNDLDVETLQALEQAIEAFPGTVLVTSHDRWFLDRIATHILAFETDGNVRFVEGNFSEYHDNSL